MTNDFVHTNDAGEDTNISESFRAMVVKIDERLMRYLNDSPTQKLSTDEEEYF